MVRREKSVNTCAYFLLKMFEKYLKNYCAENIYTELERLEYSLTAEIVQNTMILWDD